MAPDRRTGLVALALAFALTAPSSAAGPEPVADASALMRRVAQDVGALLTAPARMDRGDGLRLVGVVAVGGLLLAFDEPLAEMAERTGERGLPESYSEFGEQVGRLGLMGETWTWFAGFALAGYAVEQDRWTRFGGQVLLAQYLSGSLRNVAKLALGRRRPFERQGAYAFEWNGGTSMPSGHSASVFALGEVLALHAGGGWVRLPIYTLAGAVAWQRMTAGAHWASDVWIGAASGVAAARFVVGRHGLADPRSGRLGPVLDPEGRPAVALRWSF